MATIQTNCSIFGGSFCDSGQLDAVSKQIEVYKQKKVLLPTITLYLHQGNTIYPIKYSVIWHTLKTPAGLTRIYAQLID